MISDKKLAEIRSKMIKREPDESILLIILLTEAQRWVFNDDGTFDADYVATLAKVGTGGSQ